MANIFEEKSYKKEIKTKIKKIDKDNNIIELEDTIFYGKSGGQPGDIGEIIVNSEKIEIKDTIKSGKSIENITKDVSDLCIDQEVLARIDWQRRYKHMRMHSALHLMCAAIPL